MSQGVAKERVKLSGPYRKVSIVGCRILYQGNGETSSVYSYLNTGTTCHLKTSRHVFLRWSHVTD